MSNYIKQLVTGFALAASLAACRAQATVLVDLDLSSDTAANSGAFGDGTVNLNTNGNWENRNSTGYPVGQAFDTGANGMGTLAANPPDVGTITWTDSEAGAMDGLTSFTLYMWVKADTLPSSVARLLTDGSSLDLFLGSGQLGVTINGVGHTVALPPISSATDEWLFIGLQFDGTTTDGSVTAFAGLASESDLTFSSYDSNQTSLNSNINPLVLLNINSPDRNRPFDGALGGFYLSDDVSLSLESLFDSTKAGFVAVPEPSGGALLLLGMGLWAITGFRLRPSHQSRVA